MHVGSVAAAKLLLAKGADINAKNSRGETALLKTAGLGDTAMVRLLLEKNADVKLVANDGTTAMMATVVRRTVPGDVPGVVGT